MADLRFEITYEAINEQGARFRIGSVAISAQCLLCGRTAVPVVDDIAQVEGTSMVTVNNRNGLLCATCTERERGRL